jgi:hypothetical protein
MDKPSAKIDGIKPPAPREKIGIDVYFLGGGSEFFRTDKETVNAIAEAMEQTETKAIIVNQSIINFKNVKYVTFYGI